MTRPSQIAATAAEPAFEISDQGTKIWAVDGVFHRDDGPAVEYVNGDTYWYHHGQLHREGGPAVEWANGMKVWFRHGRRHREDGPAIEYSNGRVCWLLDDQPYTKPEWLREVLKDRALTTSQRELLGALSENWEGTPDALYETVRALDGGLSS